MFQSPPARRQIWRRLAVALTVGVAATVGCSHCSVCDSSKQRLPGRLLNRLFPNGCIDNCADIPPGAIPTHAGTYRNAYLNKMSDKAEVDDFVIRYNEFKDGTAVLGPHGREHLAQMIARLPMVPFPVIIQPEPEWLQATATPASPEDKPVDARALDESRRRVIVDLLCQAKIPDAEKRVVIGIPTAEGLFGEEGERIYPSMIQNQGGGVGGGIGGGFGGSGFGGGGFGGFGGFR
jgi:hypothetical protein